MQNYVSGTDFIAVPMGGNPLQPKLRSHHRVGLALSGGTLKATAHIGVLSALHKLGIYPDCVAGTSAGALVAALYAHGYTPEELLTLIRRFPGPSLFDYGFPFASSIYNALWYRFTNAADREKMRVPAGLMRGKKLYRYFQRMFKERTPDMPYYVIATDLVTGQPVTYSNDPLVLESGLADPIVDVARCVRGSCALPGMLTPEKIGSRVLVDGAFRHYVPVETLRQAGCEKIIAVNLYSLQKHWHPKTLVHVLARSYDILLQESVEADIKEPNIVVIEPDVSHLSWVSFRDMVSGVTAGRDAVLNNADRIVRVIRDGVTKPGGHANQIKGGIVVRFQSGNKKPPDVRG